MMDVEGEGKCVSCCRTFERKSKGFRRTGLFTKWKSGVSASEALEHSYSVTVTPGRQGFLCDECEISLKSVSVKKEQLYEAEEKFRKIRHPGSYLSKKVLITPSKRGPSRKKQKSLTVVKPKVATFSPAKKKEKINISVFNTSLGKGLHLLARYKYHSGFKKLFQGSTAARNAASDLFCDILRKEANTAFKKTSFESECFLKTVFEFDWDQKLNKYRQLCPTLVKFVTASVTSKHHYKHCTKAGRKKTISLKPVVGLVLSILGYTKSKKVSDFQKVMSLILWLSCCCKKGTIHILVEFLKLASTRPKYKLVFSSLSSIGLCQSIQATRTTIDLIKGNYDKKVIEWRDMLSGREQLDSWTIHILVEFLKLASTRPKYKLLSDELSQTDNNGSATDTSIQMVPLYSVKRSKLFYDLTFDNVNQKVGVRHHFRGKKGAMYNMVQAYATLERTGSYGLSNVMPSSDYIRDIPVSSFLSSEEDELSLKQELCIIVTRILTSNMDTFDELFSYESHRERGTLYHLKQYFDHTGVSKNVMKCFDKAEELLEFSTVGYVVLSAMYIMGIKNIDDLPEDFPETDSDRKIYRDSVASKVVEDIFESPNTKEVINVSVDKNVDSTTLCICKLDVGGPMVFCNNRNCQRGIWFHLQCIGLNNEAIPEGEWFCSAECLTMPEKKENNCGSV